MKTVKTRIGVTWLAGGARRPDERSVLREAFLNRTCSSSRAARADT